MGTIALEAIEKRRDNHVEAAGQAAQSLNVCIQSDFQVIDADR